MVYKGKGKAKEIIESYRPVAVTSQVYKLFMIIMTQRLEQWAEERGKLGEMQQGFRKGRGLMDNVYILTQLIEVARQEGRNLTAVFLDIKGAYDRVQWKDIWERLRSMEVGEGMVRVIQQLYEGSMYQFNWEDTTLDGVRCAKGLRQGCPMSPLLFALVLSELEERLVGLKNKGFKLKIIVKEVRIGESQEFSWLMILFY